MLLIVFIASMGKKMSKEICGWKKVTYMNDICDNVS